MGLKSQEAARLPIQKVSLTVSSAPGSERKDHVEVLGGQQLGLTLLEPLFTGQALTLGTMAVAAGTVDGMRVLAVVAPFDRTAQYLRAASLDGLHQTMLIQGQRMCLAVGGAV